MSSINRSSSNALWRNTRPFIDTRLISSVILVSFCVAIAGGLILSFLAKMFAHLLYTNAIDWRVFECIVVTQDNTSSSGRIFIKILFQEVILLLFDSKSLQTMA